MKKSVRRAGTDYWKHVNLSEYDNWEDFLTQRKPAAQKTCTFFEEHGEHSFLHTRIYQRDAYFGVWL